MRPLNTDIDDAMDADIQPLVELLRKDPRLLTTSSCSGHGEKPAFIDLTLKGHLSMADFVDELNRVDEALGFSADFEMALNWHRAVASSYDHSSTPEWLPFTLTIAERGKPGPSPEFLKYVTQEFRKG